MERILRWLKSMIYEKKDPEEVVVRFELPDGKKINVTAVRTPTYLPQEKKCKEHWEYSGLAVPVNNCNICWAYYASKMKQ